jgi:ATP-dependent Lhr-like helicase
MRTVLAWFRRRGWKPFDFQREVWEAYLRGESGLVHAPTGVGKTYAVWMGPLAEQMAEAATLKKVTGRSRRTMRGDSAAGAKTGAGAAAIQVVEKSPKAKKSARNSTLPLRVLWLTPLRALANDSVQALRTPVEELRLPWSVELRTGDTSQSLKAQQRDRLPTALVTTPESLSLLLSYPDAKERFSSLRCVIVDEWHELLGTKRGVQVELALARLRRWSENLRVWGLSATLGNLEEARDVLIPPQVDALEEVRSSARLISSALTKKIAVETLIPEDVERYPWSGHLGTKLVERVAQSIEQASSSLLFTNTRSQAELWFQALLEARPDWLGKIALHHGSLERKIRTRVEQFLQAGALKCVVCTSSLDLGVDFSPVDRVFQVGSPKGIARLLQRAGRSGHRPGATSTIVCVPTHSFELVEFAAARDAIFRRDVEGRAPLKKPLDVLVQHLVTIGIGGGFFSDELYSEVRTTHAYRDLTPMEWGWCLDFCVRGGRSLQAYPQYARLVADEVGRYGPANARVTRLHRLSIGTITSDTSLTIKQTNGRTLGSIEEYFIARLSPGDRFVFAGRVLELVRVREMTAYVRPARGKSGRIPRWNGARFPLSTQLGNAVRALMSGTGTDAGARAAAASPELKAAGPLLALQARSSALPQPDELLIETTRTRDGYHTFVFPFEGRLVHEGLSAVLAQRLAQWMPRTIHITCNDYGFELLATEDPGLDESAWRKLLSTEGLTDDLVACLNTSLMARRQFRDIARIAGLVFQGYPGQPQLTRHLQATSDLFFDVFRDFDADNLLLEQAQREVLDQQLEFERLRGAMERMRGMRLRIVATRELTPLAFPLWAESLRSQSISSESWASRVKKMVLRLERSDE